MRVFHEAGTEKASPWTDSSIQSMGALPSVDFAGGLLACLFGVGLVGVLLGR